MKIAEVTMYNNTTNTPPPEKLREFEAHFISTPRLNRMYKRALKRTKAFAIHAFIVLILSLWPSVLAAFVASQIDGGKFYVLVLWAIMQIVALAIGVLKFYSRGIVLYIAQMRIAVTGKDAGKLLLF